MTPSIALDILVAVLLVTTIAYAMVLNRKLSHMRKHRAALENISASFADATSRARESTLKLRGSTEELRECTGRAGAIRDDLQFLIERATATADRLEDGVRSARAGGASPSVETPARAERRPSGEGRGSQAASEADRELLRAIRAAG